MPCEAARRHHARMKIFITGGSGFIGAAVIAELHRAGHTVVALARSDASAAKLTAAGVAVHRGDMTDPAALRTGAAASDGAIHCAFPHDDFADRANNCRKDREAITALGDALAGSDRPLVITSGIGRRAPGVAITEDELFDVAVVGERGEAEHLAFTYADRRVRVSSVRLPPSVHGAGDHGFVPMLIAIAKKAGTSGYIGDGANRWPAVHRDDAARLFALAVERSPARARLHAIADTGIPTREIASAIGAKLGLPVAPVEPAHFAWLGGFFAADSPGTSALTRERYGWTPVGPGLLDDLASAAY